MLLLYIFLALVALATLGDIKRNQRYMQASLERIEEMGREIATLLATDHG
jgi:type II secretory pathway component PulJ